MKNNSNIPNSASRRKFIINLAKSGLLLPFAGQMLGQNVFAQSSGASRVLFLYYPNGATPEHWYPINGQDGTISHNNALSFSLAPLAPWNNHIIVLKNLVLDGTGGGAHAEPMRAIMSMNPNMGEKESTIDHRIAHALTSGRQAYTLGVRTGKSADMMISKPPGFTSTNRPVPNNDPFDAAQKLLTQITPGNGENNALKLSMYETIIEDFDDIANITLDAARQSKLDIHLNALRRLRDQTGNQIGECGFVATAVSDPESNRIGSKNNPTNWNRIPAICRAQINNAIGALSCNLHNVATLQLFKGDENGSAANYAFDECYSLAELARNQLNLHLNTRWNSEHESHHSSHKKDAEHPAQTRWYHELLAYTLEELQAKGMLSDTLVVMFSEVGDGNQHGGAAGCVTVAGGAGSSLQMGRIINCGSGDNNNPQRIFGTANLFNDIATLMGARNIGGGWNGRVIT